MRLTPKKIGQLLSIVATSTESKEGVSFLAKLIVQNRKTGKLGAIISSFRKDYNLKNNIIDVSVTASSESLMPNIKELAGKKVSLHKKIDPEILGGVEILAEDYLIDNTVLSKVEGIRSL